MLWLVERRVVVHGLAEREAEEGLWWVGFRGGGGTGKGRVGGESVSAAAAAAAAACAEQPTLTHASGASWPNTSRVKRALASRTVITGAAAWVEEEEEEGATGDGPASPPPAGSASFHRACGTP
jgi:hypothetical protein